MNININENRAFVKMECAICCSLRAAKNGTSALGGLDHVHVYIYIYTNICKSILVYIQNSFFFVCWRSGSRKCSLGVDLSTEYLVPTLA